MYLKFGYLNLEPFRQLSKTLMIKNYLLIALRNSARSPLHTLINILSLAIGLASCLAIYLFVADEMSFDTFHSKGRSIFRLCEIATSTGREMKNALTGSPMGPAILDEFPEVETYTRFWGGEGSRRVLKINSQHILVDRVIQADSTFLDVFDFELLYGDRATVLDEPASMIIDEKTALKFFSEADKAIGQLIKKDEREFTITGVLKDVPENSHLQFNALESMSTYYRDNPAFNTEWKSNFLNTYFVLKPHVSPKALEAKFPAWLVRWTEQKDINDWFGLFLQPLGEVHLGSTDIEHDYENHRKFNGSYIYVFIVVAFLILLIAAVNFTNLTMAKASRRWKEVGVRKTVGAKRIQIFSQFVFESVTMAFAALIIALLLNILLLPFLNDSIGRELHLPAVIATPGIFYIVIGGTFILGLLTALYPSVYMTSFTMGSVVKGSSKAGGSLFRHALMVIQFSLALAMIVSTLTVVKQFSYMKNTDLGFNKDQILLVSLNPESNKKFELLKSELLENHYILGVTASGQRIGNNFHQWGFKIKTDTGVFELLPSNVNVDYDYLKVYDIQLKDGRDFSKDRANDNGLAFIINETLAKELALKNPIGAAAGHDWYPNDSLGTIIGVAKDFNFNSLHQKIGNLSIVCHPAWGYDEMSIKVDHKHINEAIAIAQRIWEDNISTFPFAYSFLDEHFERLYRSDEQLMLVVTLMAGLAVLISCMGLLGVTGIVLEKRVKEIGIRKTLGASVTDIALMLFRNFGRLVLISFLLACPITYYLLSEWLQNFAYRTEINSLPFLGGGILLLITASATISFHTLKAARSNPAKSLRTE